MEENVLGKFQGSISKTSKYSQEMIVNRLFQKSKNEKLESGLSNSRQRSNHLTISKPMLIDYFLFIRLH